MYCNEKGRVGAARVQPKEHEDRNAAIGGVNGKNGANGSGSHGSSKRTVHLKRSGGHGVSCGLDVHYFRDAIVSRTVAEVNCRRCLRAYKALATLRCKARKWDRLAGQQPKRVCKPRPLVNLAVAFDRAVMVP